MGRAQHGLRNASVPIVTVVGIQLGHLIGGVVARSGASHAVPVLGELELRRFSRA